MHCLSYCLQTMLLSLYRTLAILFLHRQTLTRFILILWFSFVVIFHWTHQIFIAQLFKLGPQWTQTIKASLPGLKILSLGLFWVLDRWGSFPISALYFLPKVLSSVFVCFWIAEVMEKLLLRVYFFQILIKLKPYFVVQLYQEGIWYTMTFSHLQEMRRSMVTRLTEAKVHLSLTQDVKHMISTDLFAVSKLHVPWQV